MHSQMCPNCQEGSLRLPLSAWMSGSVVLECTQCGRRYRSQLSGGLNRVRNWAIAALGTVLGGGLVVMFFGRWAIWLGGLVAVAGLDSFWMWRLHRRNVATGKVTLLASD